MKEKNVPVVLRVDFRDRYGAPGITGDGLDIRRQKMEDFLKKGLCLRPDLSVWRS